MKKTKHLFIFVFVGLLVFFAIQEILTPDWSKINANVGYTVRGIKEVEDGSIDVLFLGPSTTHLGVSPMWLYKNTNICSYNLGTPNQPLAGSYYLLQEVFRYQKPSLVVLDAANLFKEENVDQGWRYILDNLSLNSTKLKMAKSYSETVKNGDILNAIMPILKYHSRWNELTKADFEVNAGGNYYTAGQFLTSPVLSTMSTIKEADEKTDYLLNMENGHIAAFENGIVEEQEINEPAYKMPFITEYGLSYLQKIKNFCEYNGAQLLIIKIPSFGLPQMVSGAWNHHRYLVTKNVLQDLGIPFLDLNYDIDTGVDYRNDTGDRGTHLNSRGAEKVTYVLGSYLTDNYNLLPCDNERYNENLIQYMEMREVFMLQSEMKFEDYIKILIKNKEKWTILISARDEYTNGMDAESYSYFADLGLKLISEGKYADSYVALIDEGKVVYEALSDRKIEYKTEINGCRFSLTSSGYYTNPDSSININGKNYGLDGRGLNFVVLDNDSKCVIDCVTFDTWQISKNVTRNGSKTLSYLRDYEAAICFGE